MSMSAKYVAMTKDNRFTKILVNKLKKEKPPNFQLVLQNGKSRPAREGFVKISFTGGGLLEFAGLIDHLYGKSNI